MALLSALFGKPKNAKIGVGDNDKELVPIDVSMSETHERTAQLTQSEIEDGSKITDHVTLDPIKLTIEGVMTDTPIGTAAAGVGALSTGASFVARRIGGEVIGAAVAAGAGLAGSGVLKLLLGGQKSADKAFKFFEELWENREPLTVVTSIRRYENMIITSLSMPRSREVGKGFNFSVSLQELRIVSSEETTIAVFKKVAPSAAKSAAKTANKGKQASKATSEKPKGSIAFEGLIGKNGFFAPK